MEVNILILCSRHNIVSRLLSALLAAADHVHSALKKQQNDYQQKNNIVFDPSTILRNFWPIEPAKADAEWKVEGPQLFFFFGRWPRGSVLLAQCPLQRKRIQSQITKIAIKDSIQM
jgi:hypothetical protein